MTEVQTQTETVETVTPKATVADRKALAKSAFVVGGDVAAIAALFGNVPNGREYLDVVYSALVTDTTMAAVADGKAAELSEVLGPIAELRETVEAAMTAAGVKVSTSRTVDPVAERVALVARVGGLTALVEHLHGATNWVTALLGEIDPADLTDEEKAIVTAATVDEKITALTDKIAALVVKAPRSASGDGTSRQTVTHVAPTAGTVLKHGDLTAGVIPTADGKVAYTYRDAAGTLHTFPSISACAKAMNGGTSEVNGWKYFGLA